MELNNSRANINRPQINSTNYIFSPTSTSIFSLRSIKSEATSIKSILSKSEITFLSQRQLLRCDLTRTLRHNIWKVTFSPFVYKKSSYSSALNELFPKLNVSTWRTHVRQRRPAKSKSACYAFHRGPRHRRISGGRTRAVAPEVWRGKGERGRGGKRRKEKEERGEKSRKTRV